MKTFWKPLENYKRYTQRKRGEPQRYYLLYGINPLTGYGPRTSPIPWLNMGRVFRATQSLNVFEVTKLLINVRKAVAKFRENTKRNRFQSILEGTYAERPMVEYVYVDSEETGRRSLSMDNAYLNAAIDSVNYMSFDFAYMSGELENDYAM